MTPTTMTEHFETFLPVSVQEMLAAGGPWCLETNGLAGLASPVVASLQAINNGYLGMRGGVGISLGKGEPRETMVAGLHESWEIVHAESAYGLARTGQTLLTLPDATELRISVDGVTMELGVGDFSQVTRSLDMAAGTLDTSLVWRSPEGSSIRVRQRCAVGLKDKSLAMIDCAVEPLDEKVQIRVDSVVWEMAQEQPEDPVGPTPVDPRAGDARSSAYLTVLSRDYSPAGGNLILRAERSRMAVALAYGHHVEVQGKEGHPVPRVVDQQVTHTGYAIETTFVAEVVPGELLRATKALSFHRTELVGAGRAEEGRREPTLEQQEETLESSKLALVQNPPMQVDRFFQEQRKELQTLWAHRDVKVEGDAGVQKALRWSIFHLLQVGARIESSGVGAKGLSGTGYDGHYFWDTEIYILPSMIFTDPLAAREALHYRYLLLDAARERAREMNQRGALFPWRTISGDEASAYYPAGTAQYHINADIAYAVDQYATVTGDLNWLTAEGLEILVETARLWEDLGFWKETPTEVSDSGTSLYGGTRSFHIYGVTGPDEYTAVVDDNFYTNVMARANLRSALKWARWVSEHRPDDFAVLADRLDLSHQEMAQWDAIVGAIHIPYDERLGIHAQDASFLSKPRWDFEGTPSSRYPLLLHFHPLVIYRHQVLKQADVVLALFLCGEEFSEEQKRADFEYYDALTTGDSSLSAATQSIVASDVGYPDLAWRYFERVLIGDLGDYYGNTDHGLHVASIGGAWAATVMGFGGLRVASSASAPTDPLLKINPRLPAQWESLSYWVQFQGQWLEVEATAASVRVRLDEGPRVIHDGTGSGEAGDGEVRPVRVLLAGHEFTVNPGQSVEHQIHQGEIPLPESTEGLGPQ